MEKLTAVQKDKLSALKQSAYFSNCGDEILQALSAGTYLRRYSRGEILFWEGEASAGLNIIRRGSVKLFKTSPQGRELIIHVLVEGETFNEVPVFDHGLNPANAAALEDAEVWVVEAETIQETMQRYPEMCQAVIQNLSRNLRLLVRKVEELSFYQVTNRLARLIYQLPEDQLGRGQTQRITQDQLAARLGTVREVVARSLRELEQSGAIRVSKRQIQVQNRQILQDWAQEPCE